MRTLFDLTPYHLSENHRHLTSSILKDSDSTSPERALVIDEDHQILKKIPKTTQLELRQSVIEKSKEMKNESDELMISYICNDKKK